MKVAVTVWDNRISPVFEAARTIMIAEVSNEEVVDRTFMRCCPQGTKEVVERLALIGVTDIICGAITDDSANMIEARSMQLTPFLAGMVEPVLDNYLRGLPLPGYRMPGCCREVRCCGRQVEVGAERKNGGQRMGYRPMKTTRNRE